MIERGWFTGSLKSLVAYLSVLGLALNVNKTNIFVWAWRNHVVLLCLIFTCRIIKSCLLWNASIWRVLNVVDSIRAQFESDQACCHSGGNRRYDLRSSESTIIYGTIYQAISASLSKASARKPVFMTVDVKWDKKRKTDKFLKWISRGNSADSSDICHLLCKTQLIVLLS